MSDDDQIPEAQSRKWLRIGTAIGKISQVVLRCLFSVLGAVPGSIIAQSYSIDWFKVAGRGGASSGGSYSISGTIGQHDAGAAMTGGNYTLL